MGRHHLRAAQPCGVSQICFGTHGPCPGNASCAFSLIVSSWLNPAQVTVKLQQEQLYRRHKQKELLGTLGAHPRLSPSLGQASTGQRCSTGAAPGSRRVGCPAALSLGGFLHPPECGVGCEPQLHRSTHRA